MIPSYIFCEMGLQESTKIVIISISVWAAYAAVYTVAAALPRRVGYSRKLNFGRGGSCCIYFTVTH